MEDSNLEAGQKEEKVDKIQKLKKWEHYPVRPETFEEGCWLKEKYEFKSYDALIREMQRIFKLYKAKQEAKQKEENGNEEGKSQSV